MKRTGTSITALALAGVLVLPLAPNASAQSSFAIDPVGSSFSTYESSEGFGSSVSTVEATAPQDGGAATMRLSVTMPEWKVGADAGSLGGANWFYHADGVHVVSDQSNVEGVLAEGEGVLSIIELAVATGRTVPANKVEELRAFHNEQISAADAQPALADWEAGVKAGELSGKAWFYHADRLNVVDDVAKTTGALPAEFLSILKFAQQSNHRLPENLVQASLDEVVVEGQVGAKTEAETGSTNPATFDGLSSSETITSKAFDFSLPSLPAYEVGQLAGTLNGESWFYNKDYRYVVNSQDLVNATYENGKAGFMSVITLAEKLNRSIPENIRFQFSTGSGSSNSDWAKAALIALPAVLLIGGVAWYLNQDGRTYVLDVARTSSVPTVEEREASEYMLSSNRAEVEAQIQAQGEAEIQGVAMTETRGVNAETGSNQFGKGLIALLLASILAAAAFIFGRRQLV